MNQTIRLGTIRGIRIGVHWSVLVIVALFAWELADLVLPPRFGHATASDWIAGVVGALLLVLSLFAHELSHALVATRSGIGVRSITLFAFGGFTQLEGEPRTPSADFRIAAAGPGESLVLAGLFRAAEAIAIALSAPAHGVPVDTLTWLWEINVALAAFNLVPAAPLDGGHILRAALWRRWHDRPRAVNASARSGQVFAVLMMGFGFALFVRGYPTGLWSTLIGWFLFAAARSEQQLSQVEASLIGVPVDRAMGPAPQVVPGGMAVADLLERWWGRDPAIAVTDDHNHLKGIVMEASVRAVPVDRRRTTTASDITTPLSDVVVTHPGDPLSDVIGQLVSRQAPFALVLDGDHVVGIVTQAEVERAAAASSRAGRADPPDRRS